MGQIDFGHYMECSLALAVDLVNTHDPAAGTDTLTSADALRDFLAEHSVSDLRTPTAGDLIEVRDLRARLRDVFEAPDGETGAARLNALLAGSGARPELTAHDGSWHLHYAPPGTPITPRLMAESAMALTVVVAEAGFERLRICDASSCREVFVDRSRNRSRRYCSPSACGNRASVAAFRARQRSAGAAAEQA